MLATSLPDSAILDAIAQGVKALVVRADGAMMLLSLVRERINREAALAHTDCGERAIELRDDGRVSVRGASVLVSSTGPAVVQGAEVRIN